jgi:hypothetical protein
VSSHVAEELGKGVSQAVPPGKGDECVVATFGKMDVGVYDLLHTCSSA